MIYKNYKENYLMAGQMSVYVEAFCKTMENCEYNLLVNDILIFFFLK